MTFLPGREVAGALAKIDSSDSSEAVKLGGPVHGVDGEAAVRGAAATWDEIDLDARTWTIPGRRNAKIKDDHVVPLSKLLELRRHRRLDQPPRAAVQKLRERVGHRMLAPPAKPHYRCSCAVCSFHRNREIATRFRRDTPHNSNHPYTRFDHRSADSHTPRTLPKQGITLPSATLSGMISHTSFRLEYRSVMEFRTYVAEEKKRLTQQRKDVQKRVSGLESELQALGAELKNIDNEMEAIQAYEAAKASVPAPARRGRARRIRKRRLRRRKREGVARYPAVPRSLQPSPRSVRPGPVARASSRR